MENGIQRTKAYTIADLQNLARYATGTPLKENDTVFQNTAGSGVSLAVMNSYSTLMNNHGHYKESWNMFKQTEAAKAAEYKKAFEGRGLKGFTKGYSTVNRMQSLEALERKLSFREIPVSDFNKMSEGAKSKYLYRGVENSYFDKTNQLIREAKNAGSNVTKAQINAIEREISQARLKIHNAGLPGGELDILKGGRKWGKAISKYSGYSGVSSKVFKVTAGNNTLSKIGSITGKIPKGTGSFAALSALCEAPEVYQTYKELGSGKGTKQLAKSAVKVGAQTAGYAVGSAIGTASAAAIGAAIGSVVPGLGTVLGLGVGILCGWLFGKGAEKIVGKNELTLARDKQAKKIAEEAEKNPEIMAELMANANQRLEAEKASPSKTTLTVQSSYDKVITQLEINRAKQDSLNKTLASLTQLSNFCRAA